MNREDARKAAEVMLAYADGKEIECTDVDGEYCDVRIPIFNWSDRADSYRIKPTPTYRPFANARSAGRR